MSPILQSRAHRALRAALILLVGTAMLIAGSCGAKSPAAPTITPQPAGQNVAPTGYDFERYGMPILIEAHHIDYAQVEKISRFRSASGHDNADAFETCRSMKHYFQPTALVPIYSPVTGVVFQVFAENSYGTQVQIHPGGNELFNVRLYHLVTSVKVGDTVHAGQVLGTHVSLATSNDVAVEISTTLGRKLVSYFDVMPDALFADLARYGITSRSQLIISKEARDADPLACTTDGAFLSTSAIPNFVYLPDGRIGFW